MKLMEAQKSLPLISVIIPVFNLEGYITRCLQSLEDQVFRDFEVIIVNDGSTDNTMAEIGRFLPNTSLPVHTITQVNRGVSAARNEGMEKARGQYLYFLDGDDYIHPELLKKCVERIEETEPDLVWFGYDKVSEKGEIIQRYQEQHTFHKTEKKGIDILPYIFFFKYHILIPGCIIKKIIIEKCNLKFFKSCILGEDFEFIGKFAFHATSIVCINESLLYYVQRGGSAMQTKTLNSYFHEAGAYKRLLCYLKNNGAPNESVDLLEYIYLKRLFKLIVRMLLDKKYIVYKIIINNKFKNIMGKINILNTKPYRDIDIYSWGIKWRFRYFLMLHWPWMFVHTYRMRPKAVKMIKKMFTLRR